MFWVHCSNLNIGRMPEIEKQIRPMLVAYDNQVSQSEAIFARLAALYPTREQLDAEDRRLLEKRYDSYRRSGATLSAEDKALLSELNQQLGVLKTAFTQNLLNDQKSVTWIDDEALLQGIPEKVKATFKRQATNLEAPEK